jgi:hypothetical protein
MAAENHSGGRSPSVNPTKVDHSIDALARGLANGSISRRQALRWMGGALVGGVLASIPGVALAQEGSNSACDEFCHANFSGRAAGQCTRNGAHGAGPCYECTPGIGPGPHFSTPQCGNEEINPETCECEDSICEQGVCGPVEFACASVPTTEGQTICIEPFCGAPPVPCNSTEDCPEGAFCGLVTECCDESVCVVLCGTLH